MLLIFPHVFGLKIDWLFLALVFQFLLGFYVVTWDELHTHTLYLTLVSAPVEGNALFTLSALATGYLGQGIWATPLRTLLPLCPAAVASMPLSRGLEWGLLVGGSLTVANSVLRVTKVSHTSVLQLLPFSVFCGAIAYCVSEAPILWDRAAPLLLYAGFSFGHAVVRRRRQAGHC